MTTKEKVLLELSKNKNSVVSGESLAASCGVSRAAIWKAVDSLRKAGCNIEGTTNGGYIITETSDAFSKEIVAGFFYGRFPEFKSSLIECFSEIDSTNTHAKKLLSECGALRNENGKLTDDGKKLNNALIVAEKQTAGRGRLGRTFVSPFRTGIYLSLIYIPEGGITEPARLTAFSAVAVCRVIKRLYKIDSAIKWINDIFVEGKKVCGILTEGFANFETGKIESAVIGIGINIEYNRESFKGEVSKTAGSLLKKKRDSEPGRAELAAEIAGEVLRIFNEPAADVLKEYKSLSFIIGRELQVRPLTTEEETYSATAVDIDENASLVVELPDGTKRTLSSGEVSLGSGKLAE